MITMRDYGVTSRAFGELFQRDFDQLDPNNRFLSEALVTSSIDFSPPKMDIGISRWNAMYLVKAASHQFIYPWKTLSRLPSLWYFGSSICRVENMGRSSLAAGFPSRVPTAVSSIVTYETSFLRASHSGGGRGAPYERTKRYRY
jgi:hypothetical protein